MTSSIPNRDAPSCCRPAIDEHVVWYEGSGTSDRRWFAADERGSIAAIINSSGAATTRNTYDEYGLRGGSNAGRFQYTGQPWLPEVSLYHYRARAYSPTLGRFMQTDPILHQGGMNLYNFGGVDPVNRADPFGLTDISAFGGAEYDDRFGWSEIGRSFDIPGTLTVGVHGNIQGFMGSYDRSVEYTSADIALYAYTRGQPVFLLGCNLGLTNIPTDIARMSGQTVWAASRWVWLNRSDQNNWVIYVAGKTPQGGPGARGAFIEFDASGATGRTITNIVWNRRDGTVTFTVENDNRTATTRIRRPRRQTITVPWVPPPPPAPKPDKKE